MSVQNILDANNKILANYLPPGGGGITNPLTANLDANGFDITGAFQMTTQSMRTDAIESLAFGGDILYSSNLVANPLTLPYIEPAGGIKDKVGSLGLAGQVLSSDGAQVEWVAAGGGGFPPAQWASFPQGLPDNTVPPGTAISITPGNAANIYNLTTGMAAGGLYLVNISFATSTTGLVGDYIKCQYNDSTGTTFLFRMTDIQLDGTTYSTSFLLNYPVGGTGAFNIDLYCDGPPNTTTFNITTANNGVIQLI